MYRRLGSAILSQLAFPVEGNLHFPWEKSHWDNTVVKSKVKKKDKKVKYCPSSIVMDRRNENQREVTDQRKSTAESGGRVKTMNGQQQKEERSREEDSVYQHFLLSSFCCCCLSPFNSTRT